MWCGKQHLEWHEEAASWCQQARKHKNLSFPIQNKQEEFDIAAMDGCDDCGFNEPIHLS